METNPQLLPAKIDGDVNRIEEDDVMIYEPVHPVIEITDSDDETSVPNAGGGASCVESDNGSPVTFKEELQQNGVCSYETENSDRTSSTEPKLCTFERVHTCDSCLAQFKSKAAFVDHQTKPCRKFEGDVFKCATCGREFTSYENLKVHTSVIHKYVCPKCNDTFRYLRYLEDHVVKCTGTNQLNEDMEQQITQSTTIATEIEQNMLSPQTEISPNCSVILERLKIPAGEQTYELESSSDTNDEIADLPRPKIRTASSPVSNDENNVGSTCVDTAPDSCVSSEPDEVIDVESTACTTETEEDHKESPVAKKIRKSRWSVSSGEEVIKNYSGRGRPRSEAAKNNSPPTRKLRARRPICLAEPDCESDSEKVPELMCSSGNSKLDPDFEPHKHGNKRGRRRRQSDYDSADSQSTTSSSSTNAVSVKCGECNAPFTNIKQLLAHHRLPQKCGEPNPESVLKCDDCNVKFVSQSMLDEHLNTPESCCKSGTTTNPANDVDLLNCAYCEKSFSSLYNLRFHLKSSKKCSASARLGSDADEISSADENSSKGSSAPSGRRPQNNSGPHVCQGCKVIFNSGIGLGLHLKRSQKCIADNPDVDIPGVIDKRSIVDDSPNNSDLASSFMMKGIKRTNIREPDANLVFVCVKCYSSFSSIWGLRTHERNSVGCKSDRQYEIPVPVPKEEADRQKKEFLAKQQKDVREESSSTASSSSTNKGFTMVYTQESQDKDGKYKCKKCTALFSSVWGLRTHQRISQSCADKNASRFPHPHSKTKIILSGAAAKSIAKGENICPNCSARFSTPWGLRTHLRTSDICSESETVIKVPDSKRPREGQIISCTECKMVFVHLRELRDHVKYNPSCLPEDASIGKNGSVQPGIGFFLCPQCPNTYKLPFDLEQHFVEHAPKKDRWLCHFCIKEFTDQFAMHRHFHREHLGKWVCLICDKNVYDIGSFKAFYSHIFTHHSADGRSLNELFKCPICCKSFQSKFSYDFHVEYCTKMAERVFHCSVCQKVFNKKIHITNHMKYAHGVAVDERFNCPSCPQQLPSEADDLQEESVDDLEMPCDICGEAYVGFDKLQLHVEIAHKKRSELHSGRKSPLEARRTPELSRPLTDTESHGASPGLNSPKATAGLTSSPKAATRLSTSSKATTNLKNSSKASTSLTSSPKAATRLSTSSKATTNLKNSSKASRSLASSPKASKSLTSSPKASKSLTSSPKASTSFTNSPIATAGLTSSPKASTSLTSSPKATARLRTSPRALKEESTSNSTFHL